VEFRLFGPLQVRDDAGGMCQVSQGRLRTLLAALLVHAGAVVSTDALTEYVWGEAVPGRPRVALQVMVTRLRGSLGPQGAARIRTVRPGYLCEVRPGELDVARFEELHRAGSAALVARDWASAEDSLARALGLWRGQPLADVPTGAALDRYTAQLECTRLHARRQLVEAGLHLGRHTELLDDISVLAQEHPLDEELRAQWMLALYRSGRQSEALDVYQQTHRTLAQEIGVDPAPPLRELHQRILNADPSLSVPPAGGTGAAKIMAPCQLPTATRTFTGRAQELEQLLELARRAPAGSDAEMVVISAIDGMGGVGKSALAIHAAHRVRGLFPDGQLFVDLLGHTPGLAPLTAGDALSRILRTLGVPPQRIPVDLDQRTALYRRRLADTRTLIILDNAADTAQVRPLLLDTPGCLVVVTSRRRLTGLDDANVISLDTLTPDEALTLLQRVTSPRRATEDGPEVRELLALCGFLPLAVRMTAARLRQHRTLSVRDLVEQLRDEHHRLDHVADKDRNLTAVFETSYNSLPEPEQHLFRRLGLVPGPDFDAYAAASLTGTDHRTAERLLESLLDHHLLTQPTPGRYQFHDLVRLYARALDGADAAPDGARERGRALERLLDYYQHTAAAADRHLARHSRPAPAWLPEPPAAAPTLPNRAESLVWMRNERENLLSAVTHADTQPRRAIALSTDLAAFLLQEGPWPRAVDLHQNAAAAAHQHGDRSGEAGALWNLARVRQATGASSEAIGLMERALTIYRDIGDRQGEANTLAELGRTRFATADPAEAAAAAEQALVIYQDIGDRRGEANALSHLARVRQLRGDFPGATGLLERALPIYHEVGDALGEANTLWDLGGAEFVAGDYPAAGRLQERAVVIYRDIGSLHGEANALWDLGRVRHATHDYAASAHLNEQALVIYQEIGHRHGEANALAGLGRVRHSTGDFDAAAGLYEQALAITREIGHRHSEASALLDLGRTGLAARDFTAAADFLDQALKIFQDIGDRQSEAETLNETAELIARTVGPHEALDIYQQALHLARQTSNPVNEAMALEGTARCLAQLSTPATPPSTPNPDH